MKRRQFLKHAAVGPVVAGGLATVSARAGETIKWKMVTSWPKNFPGLGSSPDTIARLIEQMSGGRMQVKVYGAGELVPPFEVFDAVMRGTAEMGNSASYYWKGKTPAAQFFTTVPFGMTALEMNAWLLAGGGMELWREVYEPFGLLPVAAGNTGAQMGGWFNKEIASLKDLEGLKMRIPGLGGEVLKRLGATPVNVPLTEVFTSLTTGALDAAEWVGPYNDLALGLHKAAKYYYYPAWHDPSGTMETTINRKAFDALPADLQAVVTNACLVANQAVLAEFTARNHAALDALVNQHGVQLRRFPDEVLKGLKQASEMVVAEIAEADPVSRKVYESFRAFQNQVVPWHDISERAYMNARAL